MADGDLLRAQERLDRADDANQPIKRGNAARAGAAIAVTVIGAALAPATIETVDGANERREPARRLPEMLAPTHGRTGLPRDCNPSAANHWPWMLAAKTRQAVTRRSLQEYASAVVDGLTVVERPRACHDALRDLGVSVRAPEEDACWRPRKIPARRARLAPGRPSRRSVCACSRWPAAVTAVWSRRRCCARSSARSGRRALAQMGTVDSSKTETFPTPSKTAVDDARQSHGATLRKILG